MLGGQQHQLIADADATGIATPRHHDPDPLLHEDAVNREPKGSAGVALLNLPREREQLTSQHVETGAGARGDRHYRRRF
jgi:hypothetical protein